MKKYVLLILSLLAMTSASCSNGKPSNNQKSETNKQEQNMKAIHLTKADFLAKVANFETNPTKWEYLGDKPAIIDFYADWCGPCKVIAPVLEELAGEYEGQIYVYKINTETEPELAAAFGIRSIPSLLFVPMNDTPQMAAGALPKQQLKQAIDEVLLKK